MNLESLSESLAKVGFFALIHRRRGDWHCSLFNDVIRSVPVGVGPTALDAMLAANDERLKMMVAAKG